MDVVDQQSTSPFGGLVLKATRGSSIETPSPSSILCPDHSRSVSTSPSTETGQQLVTTAVIWGGGTVEMSEPRRGKSCFIGFHHLEWIRLMRGFAFQISCSFLTLPTHLSPSEVCEKILKKPGAYALFWRRIYAVATHCKDAYVLLFYQQSER